MMNWVYGYDDRESVNMCLLYRYIISYEPRDFRGHLEEFPLTLEYGKKVDALRKRYQGFRWDAEFQDTVGATVEVAGGDQATSVSRRPYEGEGPLVPPSGPVYSVFRRMDSGRKAVVVVNQGASLFIARVSTGWKSRFIVVSPEDPEPRVTDGQVHVPLRSAVVVMETE
jgi:hypothetical protein